MVTKLLLLVLVVLIVDWLVSGVYLFRLQSVNPRHGQYLTSQR